MADALARARAAFDPNPDWAYLDTATFGLPPGAAVERLASLERAWQRGDIDWPAEEGRLDQARTDFAALVGTDAASVAFLPSISLGVGFVATSLPRGAEVLLPVDEYASIIQPLLVAAERRGVVVREVPFERLTDEIRPTTRLVAVSSIQMHTGRAPELAALVSRCRETGARLLVDATQGVPFQDLEPSIEGIDFLVAAGYKHLLSPHGVAFLVVRRDRWDELGADAANGRALVAGSPSIGGPLRLQPTAARFETAMAWLPWYAAAESLRLLRSWQAEGLFAEVRRLIDRLAVGLGLPSPPASLVCLPVSVRDADAAMAALNVARVRAALRYGYVRLSPHLWTTDADIDRAVEALRPFAHHHR
jgi:selenocysteine lyase/cysteine desulfurase